MIYPYKIETFKMTFVAIYIKTAGDKAMGTQIFKLFEDLCHNAGPNVAK